MNNKELFESWGKSMVEGFIKGITQIAHAFKKIKVKSTNIEYIKQFEKQELFSQINTTFNSQTIQKRYDDIVTALKYTKHSKKREQLLKVKRMYEKLGIVEG